MPRGTGSSLSWEGGSCYTVRLYSVRVTAGKRERGGNDRRGIYLKHLCLDRSREKRKKEENGA